MIDLWFSQLMIIKLTPEAYLFVIPSIFIYDVFHVDHDFHNGTWKTGPNCEYHPAGAFGGIGPTWNGRIISLSS